MADCNCLALVYRFFVWGTRNLKKDEQKLILPQGQDDTKLESRINPEPDCARTQRRFLKSASNAEWIAKGKTVRIGVKKVART